ncbi:MAG: nitronate monooxygenase [Cytophagales bacterium]|nr:MAG: nitronate monooxygenase [Cytophagales bacterium]
MFPKPITDLFGIQIPIIQAGMVWCSGWKLASAVSNSGALGLIGAGSMSPEILREHIKKCKEATEAPFGVNLPLIYPRVEEQIGVIIEEKVKIVFTSAGNPALWTNYLKSHGVKVTHVVSSSKFALKAQEAGCDAIVAEGFEAGGHNGKEETTTFCLIPMVAEKVKIPIIAAGGIGSGKSILAAMVLGASAVQIGSLFATAEESSAHLNFKQKVIASQEGDTMLTLKSIQAVRLLKNEFYQKVNEQESKGIDNTELKILLGKGRSRIGIFEGNLQEGELEIGQIAASIKKIKPAKEIIENLWAEFEHTKAIWRV